MNNSATIPNYRTPSIFYVTDNTDASADAEKVNLQLIQVGGDQGLVGLDQLDPVARDQRNQFSKFITCSTSQTNTPAQNRFQSTLLSTRNAGNKAGITPSVFTCTSTDPICQRALFLNNGWIALGNDPAPVDIRSLTNQQNNNFALYTNSFTTY
jgi:hypothetical protein